MYNVKFSIGVLPVIAISEATVKIQRLVKGPEFFLIFTYFCYAVSHNAMYHTNADTAL